MNEFRFICTRLISDERVVKILTVTERHIELCTPFPWSGSICWPGFECVQIKLRSEMTTVLIGLDPDGQLSLIQSFVTWTVEMNLAWNLTAEELVQLACFQ